MLLLLDMMNNLKTKFIKYEDYHPLCVYSDYYVYIVIKHKVPQFVELKMVCKGYEEMT